MRFHILSCFMSHQISDETSGSSPQLSGSQNFALQSLECRCRGGGALGVGVWVERAHHPISSTCPQMLLLCLLFCAVSSLRSCLITWSPLCHPCCVWVHLFQPHPVTGPPTQASPWPPEKLPVLVSFAFMLTLNLYSLDGQSSSSSSRSLPCW